MNLLVCLKQVPAGGMHIRPDTTGRWIEPGRDDEYVISRYDEYALEEAVRIKEHFPGTTVEALSMGPDRCRAVIRRALAKGADSGIHLYAPAPGFLTPETVADAIAGACQTRRYDLVLTGVISEDLMQGVTGPLLAARLGWPCATAVVRQRIEPRAATVQVTCELEGGWTENVRLALPALLTIQSGINRPRYPSLSGMMRSRKQALIRLPFQDREQLEPAPMFTGLRKPAVSGGATFFQGSLEEKAGALLDLLAGRGMLIT